MRCNRCEEGADGLAVIPGIGEAGEIRFYCDGCARRDRVKMRYWDGRDLDVGGWRESPDLGRSFETLVFGFPDLARMRHEDLRHVLTWVEDKEIAAALAAADPRFLQRVLSALPPARMGRVRDLLETPAHGDPREAQSTIVSVVRRL